MSSIQDSAMHIWVNGETITQDKLEQNRKVFETAINDNQSQINAQYTNAQIDAKVNTASSTTKVVQSGTAFPSSGLVDGQEFYRDDLHIMYLYDAALNKWVDRGSIALQGFRNLLDPSKQSFTRASNATRKDLTPVPFNVLRTEQGKFGQGAFIEESTTNLPYNTDFETFTGTATVFSDAMTAGTTADPAWTVQSGSFTWSTSGATCGASGAILTAGNNAWKPLTGSNGTVLALTVQATFTTPATLSANNNGSLYLQVDGNNKYIVYLTNSQFILNKETGGTWASPLGTVAQTLTVSTAYTITLAITPSGGLTAKLYSGVGTGGTLLQTLTATDTSLTGGFLIGVGGDTGVIIKSAQVTAPFADVWNAPTGDTRVAWALTSNAISGSYSISAVGVAGAISSIANAVPSGTISSGQTATYSVFANGSNLGVGKALIKGVCTGGTVVSSTALTPSGTFSTQRIVGSVTAGTGNTGIYAELDICDSGTVIFDCVQIEIKNYPTTYVRNDSTSASATRNADSLSYTLSNPLPSRYFDAVVWTPEQASSVSRTNARALSVATDLNGNQQYSVNYDQSTGVFKFLKGASTYLSSSAISFNALDRIFVAWEDEPTIAGQMTLWVGVNSGALQTFTLANTTAVTTAQKVYVGGAAVSGYECNGTIDYPIITDIIPTPDQVQALYQASDWGGDRNYPGVLPNQVNFGTSTFSIRDITGYNTTAIERSKGSINIQGQNGYNIAQNCWTDGVNWYRFDTTKPASILTTDPNSNDAPRVFVASAGSNPISWTQVNNLLQALSGGYKVQSGTVSISATGSAYATQTVTFPTAYSVAPLVLLQSTVTGYRVFTKPYSITTSGFTAQTYNMDATVTDTLVWIAIGS